MLRSAPFAPQLDATATRAATSAVCPRLPDCLYERSEVLALAEQLWSWTKCCTRWLAAATATPPTATCAPGSGLTAMPARLPPQAWLSQPAHRSQPAVHLTSHTACSAATHSAWPQPPGCS